MKIDKAYHQPSKGGNSGATRLKEECECDTLKASHKKVSVTHAKVKKHKASGTAAQDGTDKNGGYGGWN